MFVPARMCMLASGYKNYSPPGLPCGCHGVSEVQRSLSCGGSPFDSANLGTKKSPQFFGAICQGFAKVLPKSPFWQIGFS